MTVYCRHHMPSITEIGIFYVGNHFMRCPACVIAVLVVSFGCVHAFHLVMSRMLRLGEFWLLGIDLGIGDGLVCFRSSA